MTQNKQCFVICPIGTEGSDVRDRSNKLMEHIIEEAFSEFDYNITRADQMSEPGSITAQIIEKVVESDLVVADLTNHNPNVFYELAVRHATAKPYIQLIDSSENIPFDISDFRTISYDFDISKANDAIEKIKNQVEKIEQSDGDFDSPISKSADLMSWRESEDPIQQNLAELTSGIYELNKKIDNVQYIVADRSRGSLEDFTKEVEENQGPFDDVLKSYDAVRWNESQESDTDSTDE